MKDEELLLKPILYALENAKFQNSRQYYIEDGELATKR